MQRIRVSSSSKVYYAAMFQIRRNRRQKRGGFTLIEILLSVAVLSSLFIFVSSKMDIAAIFAELTSTGEEIGVQAYGKAVGKYRWETEGDIPSNSNITPALKFICKQTVSQADCAAAEGVYFGDFTNLAKYPIHKDYVAPSELMTGYQIQYPYGSGGRARVTVPDESSEYVY